MSKIVAIQEHLRPALQPVFGCKDYEDEKRLLERVDLILRHSGVDRMFLELSQEQFEANAAKLEAAGEQVQTGAKAIERYLTHSSRALRCTVLKNLVGGSYREISKVLAMSPLYRWFCGLEEFALIRVPGKSTLRDYAHWLPAQQMEKILATLTRAVCDEEHAREIGLESELDLSVAWVDTTCLKACIHFPTDWVLLRDAVRTLVKCILTIRRHGLKRRIPEPEDFLRQINALSMGMSAAARRKPGSKRKRKRVLRAIKGLSKLVEEHGQRYRDALDKHWNQSDLTHKEAEVILRRMDNVLIQLPPGATPGARTDHRRTQGCQRGENLESLRERSPCDRSRQSRGGCGIWQQPVFGGERRRVHFGPRVKTRDQRGRCEMASTAVCWDEGKKRGSALRGRGRPRL